MQTLQIGISDGIGRRIEKMRELSRSTGKVDVIRKALATYDTILHECSVGSQVFIREPDGNMRELEIQ